MDSTTYDIVLFLHLVGAMLLIAGIAIAGVGFELARRCAGSRPARGMPPSGTVGADPAWTLRRHGAGS